jgi:S-DNA-T family DNA segregation ATPase FtsK/SpoIIIE
VDRDGGAVVLATSSLALAGRFRGLDVSVARLRTGILLRPCPEDGPLLGLPRTAVPPSAGGWPAGRGLLVLDGRATPLQVLAGDPADAPVGAAQDTGPRVTPARRTPRPEPAR